MRKDAIISMRNAATVLLACAIVLLCFAWRSPAYASVSGSIELSCGAEHAGEHVALAGDGYALTKVASAEVDGASASVAYATEEAFSSVDRNWAALDGAGLRAAAHEVFAHAEKHGVKPQATAHADAAGKAVFSSLEPGLYLISRFEVVPANAEFSCDPALVSVPATIDGVLTYAVEVTPKFEHEPLTPGPDSGPGEDGKPADPLDQLADKVAGALGFAKTSDGMFALGFDVAVRPRGRMAIVLDGRIFCRKAESIPTHRMKHVVTAHLGIASNNVADGIVARMTHMGIARRIREHFEHVFLRLGRILGHDVLAVLLPYRLPSRLYFMRVVFFHLQLLMIARCMASRPLKHEFVLLYGGVQE